ncbi:hypothetical protein UCRPC4_g00749 [Phaeomoniella chlamydospora]|uniref:Glycine-rich cell wall structural protein 1 n=1 Tax=Phaeomoniella chlamydospora TaxID=158046 RepID=A0A0G2HHL5_PHACM|nr:hypothetical protein UCRPC4_g00749 [Phaeomoniella chlamydospora]
MQAISSLANTARASIWGSEQTGVEPPSGETGKGTAIEPYDAEQDSIPPSSTSVPSGEEPPSGKTGKGTAADPYDGGNAPEQDTAPLAATTTEQPTASDERRPTSGNARMPSFAVKQTTSNSTVDPTSAAAEATATDPNITSTHAPPSDTNPKDAIAKNTIKKNEEYSPFTQTKRKDDDEDSIHLKPERGISDDRSLSPGEMPDGSHSETGRADKPKLSEKLKGKFHIGGKH